MHSENIHNNSLVNDNSPVNNNSPVNVANAAVNELNNIESVNNEINENNNSNNKNKNSVSLANTIDKKVNPREPSNEELRKFFTKDEVSQIREIQGNSNNLKDFKVKCVQEDLKLITNDKQNIVARLSFKKQSSAFKPKVSSDKKSYDYEHSETKMVVGNNLEVKKIIVDQQKNGLYTAKVKVRVIFDDGKNKNYTLTKINIQANDAKEAHQKAEEMMVHPDEATQKVLKIGVAKIGHGGRTTQVHYSYGSKDNSVTLKRRSKKKKGEYVEKKYAFEYFEEKFISTKEEKKTYYKTASKITWSGIEPTYVGTPKDDHRTVANFKAPYLGKKGVNSLDEAMIVPKRIGGKNTINELMPPIGNDEVTFKSVPINNNDNTNADARYQLGDNRTISIFDPKSNVMTQTKAEVLVNAASSSNITGEGQGGVDKMIYETEGSENHEIRKNAQEEIEKNNLSVGGKKLFPGSVLVTPPGDFSDGNNAAKKYQNDSGKPCETEGNVSEEVKYLMHTAGVDFRSDKMSKEESFYYISQCYYNCLMATDKLDKTSIAFSEISTGIYSNKDPKNVKLARKAMLYGIRKYYKDKGDDAKVKNIQIYGGYKGIDKAWEGLSDGAMDPSEICGKSRVRKSSEVKKNAFVPFDSSENIDSWVKSVVLSDPIYQEGGSRSTNIPGYEVKNAYKSTLKVGENGKAQLNCQDGEKREVILAFGDHDITNKDVKQLFKDNGYHSDYNFLSNYYDQDTDPIIYEDGKKYRSAEHLVHIEKFRDNQSYNGKDPKILLHDNGRTPNQIRNLSTKIKRKLGNNSIKKSNEATIGWQKKIARYKYLNKDGDGITEAGLQLLLTGNKILIEGNVRKDVKYGAQISKEGNSFTVEGVNILGRVTMEFRDLLLAQIKQDPTLLTNSPKYNKYQQDLAHLVPNNNNN